MNTKGLHTMLKNTMVVLVVVTSACTHSSETAKPAPTEAERPVTKVNEPLQPEPAATPEPPAPPAEPKVAAGKLLLPPSEMGTLRFFAEGCAAEGQGAASRSTPASASNGDKPEAVAVSSVSGGVVLSHSLEHTCCLTADAAMKLDESKKRVTLTETFSGKACRCRCSSTLKTAVALPKGTYELEVMVVSPGVPAPKSAWVGSVTAK